MDNVWTIYSYEILITNAFVNKPYVNGVILTGQNLPLKYCYHLQLVIYFGKWFWSFHTGNIGSDMSKGCKVNSCQIWSSQENVCCFDHYSQSVRKHIWPQVRVRLGLNDSQSLTVSDPLTTVYWQYGKISTLSQSISKVKEAGIIIRMDFALYKWPHFHRAQMLAGQF